ncbi:MAG: response regulator transcription factor [Verrucomicrobiae bacterium]|nr:response regulator transcription factor [Verrucomicrobiae bacterium]
MKILIAEDDTMSRLILKRTLEKLGHEVIEARDGREAWAAFEREDVPVLISDKNMPDMDGLELCRRIRAQNRKKYTYIIVITGSDAGKGFLEAMDAGADDYATKPFVEEQLAARLRVAQRILRLQEEIKQLIIRTCCYCGQMLNEQGQWVPGDPSVDRFRNVALSHSICPACWEKHAVPELEAYKQRRRTEAAS